jgi:hypothetical protein
MSPNIYYFLKAQLFPPGGTIYMKVAVRGSSTA